jgi:hypothetical protein
MGNDKAKEVLTQFERLSEEDKDSIAKAFIHHFGQIRFSLDELTKMDLKDLEIIKSTISGLILTRECLPDILMEYKTKDNVLPSKISFGIHSERDKD